MQPSPGVAPFDDRDWLFEPWWPGVRALASVEDGHLVRLQAEGLADALTTFSDLADELPERLMEDGVVLDGWLLALDDGGWLDSDLLRERLLGDRHAGRPAFVASDLLWSGGSAWHGRPFAARRERLEAVLLDGDRCVVSHALRGEGTLLAEALSIRARGHLGPPVGRAISVRRRGRRLASHSRGAGDPHRAATTGADPAAAVGGSRLGQQQA